MKYVAAVDVGGTSIKAALVSSDFEILDTKSAPTPKGDSTGVETARAIAQLVFNLNYNNPLLPLDLQYLELSMRQRVWLDGLAIWAGKTFLLLN